MGNKGLTILIASNIVAITLALVLSWLLWSSVTSSIKAYEDLYLARRKIAVAETWREAFKNNETIMAHLSDVFVTPNSLVSFIEEMEHLAQNQAVSLTISEPVQTDQSLELNLGLRGGFSETHLFLEQLGNLPYDLTVENLSLQGSNGAWSGSAHLALKSFDGKK